MSGAVSLCEWDPAHNCPAEVVGRWQLDPDGEVRRHEARSGCEEVAVLSLGHKGDWHLCAACAELPRFRRYRVARVIGRGVELRRDSAGWWVDGLDFPDRPAPLADVLGRFPCKKESAP